jgi:hypothetical protein
LQWNEKESKKKKRREQRKKEEIKEKNNKISHTQCPNLIDGPRLE